MATRAVLFDVGGPLLVEDDTEADIDRQIRALLTRHGLMVSDHDYAAANDWAIEVFAPNTYKAIIWRLCADYPELPMRLSEMPVSPAVGPALRPGISDVVRRLAQNGIALGLAANQDAAIVNRLDRLGIGRYFAHREVAGTHGYRKPDVRLFLRACADLRVAPADCIMVGDRIDNDIVPARTLGMRTILFRTGRHRAQQPRSLDERADVEVRDVAELDAALRSLGA